jgi:hypothetical protein
MFYESGWGGKRGVDAVAAIAGKFLSINALEKSVAFVSGGKVTFAPLLQHLCVAAGWAA